MKRLGIWLIAAMLPLVLSCSGGGGGGSPPGGGNAGTAVPMTLAKLFGVQSVAVHAKAVAIIGFPNAIPAHAFFPMAVSSDMLQNYTSWRWLFGPTVSLGNNNGYAFSGLGSWWSTFAASSGNIQTLETPGSGFGNPTSLNLPASFPTSQAGSSIYTQAWNSKTTDIPALFQAVQTNKLIGQTVFLPVVDASGSGLTAITGVVPFQITGVTTNPNSIQGQFVVVTNGLFGNNFTPEAITMPGSTPGGNFSFVLTPPKLVQ
jgi:hypothetical protein